MLDVVTLWLTICGKNHNYVTLKQTVGRQQIYILSSRFLLIFKDVKIN